MYRSALRISVATSSGRSACRARWLTVPIAMADRADRDLLLEIVLEGLEQLDIPLVAILHLQGPHVAPAPLQVDLDGVGVAGVLHHTLHVGVAPAGVDP